MTRLVVVGDALLDCDIVGHADRLCPDAPAPVVVEQRCIDRAGGAALAASMARRAGHDVVLVSALGRRGDAGRVRELLRGIGVEVADAGVEVDVPRKTRVVADGTVVARLDREPTASPAAELALADEARRAIGVADAVLVADYGRGATSGGDLRCALTAAARSVPVVWDPHPRGSAPVPGAWMVTPNRRELEGFFGADVSTTGTALHRTAELARQAVARWRVRSVVVTTGARGAVLATGEPAPLVVPAPTAVQGDTCGAGDVFAATAAAALAGGAVLSDATIAAVEAASRFVRDGGAAGLDPASTTAPVSHRDRPTDVTGDDASRIVEQVRRAGGTVVATGGCFDLLHAGHVGMLERARAQGDCLVVCLNSDASVRALKGERRPLVPAADRARVLAALACVDAVVLFDEPTPIRVLRELRPDVFVKGGDYDGRLPEAELLHAWGGQAVLVPYLDGRSTTRLVKELSDV